MTYQGCYRRGLKPFAYDVVLYTPRIEKSTLRGTKLEQALSWSEILATSGKSQCIELEMDNPKFGYLEEEQLRCGVQLLDCGSENHATIKGSHTT
jgi:hypothetical protein